MLTVFMQDLISLCRHYTNWTSFDVNDIFWQNAVIVSQRIWPVNGILPEAKWIWTAGSPPTVYCRTIIHGK